MAAAFEGLEAARLRRGKDEVRVVVKLPEAVREDPASMEALFARARPVPSGTQLLRTSEWYSERRACWEELWQLGVTALACALSSR